MRKLIAVDGTYPFDSNRWKMVKGLSLVEAAEMVGLKVSPEEVEEHEASRFPTCYLWLNKGFVILGKPVKDEDSRESFNLAMMEMFGGSPEKQGIKSGDKAVYLADGHYYLIERI